MSTRLAPATRCEDLNPHLSRSRAETLAFSQSENVASAGSPGGGKLSPIGNGRDPLLEVSPERSPWTLGGREEDIVDEARRRMRDEHSSKPTIVRPDRLLT